MKNQRPFSSYKKKRDQDHSRLGKIDRILIDIQKKMRKSIKPVSISNLNSYERKRIHSFFDDKEDFETKTYNHNGRSILKVFPIGNLKKLAKEKAEWVLETGNVYTFPYLSKYERYIIHNYLKEIEGIETKSIGEQDDRRLEIRPIKFGRTLKRIMKKIKLF